jgi:hypothetical protein
MPLLFQAFDGVQKSPLIAKKIFDMWQAKNGLMSILG